MAVNFRMRKGKKEWYAQVDFGVTIDGKRDRRTRTASSEKGAMKAELSMLVEKEGLHGRADRMPLSTFIDDYYLPSKKGLHPSTLAGYERDIKRIKPVLGNMRLGQIDPLKVQMLINTCPTRKVAENTRAMLRQILNVAVKLEAIAKNVAADTYVMPKKIDSSAPETWITDFTEHKRIIEAADTPEIERLLVLGLCFGLRKGEILGLDWQGVDLKKRTIRIYQTYTVGSKVPTPPKTAKSRRTLPINDLAYEYLLKWNGNSDKITRMGPVCIHKEKRSTPARARDVLRRFFERSPKLPRVTCASMRHSFATAYILSGGNVATLSKWLGHANMSTTLNRYVKPLQTDLEDAAKEISTLYTAGNGRQKVQKCS
jgi:integrase